MNGFEYRAIGPSPEGIFRAMTALILVLLFAACSMAQQVRPLAVEGGFRGPGDSWANVKVEVKDSGTCVQTEMWMEASEDVKKGHLTKHRQASGMIRRKACPAGAN